MPTIARIGPYRFFFYSSDRAEPPHVHVERDDSAAKFWLEPVRLERSGGFRGPELRKLERVVVENAVEFRSDWHGFFGDESE